MMRRNLSGLVFLTVCSVSAWCMAADRGLDALEEQAFKEAVALVEPSIVRIETVGGLDRVNNILVSTAPTTGVVVSSDGYVISSSFNFAAKPASILVQLPDGRRLPARLVASDRSKMLTLLKIDADGLTPARSAPPESFQVGQWALALGRTLDSDTPSVSVGIVSALNRIWGKAIQTDAKVSPMNYGGPLVDIQGRVLGVLVPLSPQGTGETAGVEWYDSGIGFAIPLRDVYAALDRLKEGKDLLPGLAGITFRGGDLGSEAAVDRVRYGSPAEKAGIQSGDVIVEAEETKISRVAQLRHVLGRKYADDTVRLTVKRDDKLIPMELTLVGELLPYESAFLGILPNRAMDSDSAEPGAVVRFVYPGSPAAAAGLEPKDRVTRLNETDITSARRLMELVSRLRPEEQGRIEWIRDGEKQSAEVTFAAIPNTVPAELPSEVIPAGKVSEDDATERKDDAAPAAATTPKTGRFTETPPGHEQSYWAYVPEEYNAEHPYGLMVWIHPGGDTMEAAMYKLWKPICDRRGIILLAPKAEKIAGWTPTEAEFVKDSVEELRRKYTIDPRRIFLHSYSSGGPFASHLAFKYRELFRGLALVSAPVRGVVPENEPDHRLQFYFLRGADDDALKTVKTVVEALRKVKYPVVFTTLDDLGKQYPTADQLGELSRWADSLDRL